MSDRVTEEVARIVRPDYVNLAPTPRLAFLELLSTIVRKCAHFCEFGLLGFNLMGWLRLRRWERPRIAAARLAWLLGTLYAVTDELHQLLVSERAPGLLDVLIDSAGVLAGALVMMAGMVLVEKKRGFIKR